MHALHLVVRAHSLPCFVLMMKPDLFPGMGLTGGICDAGGLADCLIGVLRKGCDDSLLDKYSEIRLKKWKEVTNPMSYGNTTALRDTDPEKAKEAEPFKTMNSSPEARRKMMESMHELG